MGIIEEISQLKSQGISDQQIADYMSQAGYPPKQINDALNQFQIKSAINSENYNFNSPQQQEYSSPQTQQGMYTPQTQEIENPPSPQQYYQEQSPAQEQYNSGYATTNDADTIIEISEQVFIEKSKTMQKQIEKLEEFKAISETKLQNISERLKKIEDTIDKLQLAILEKIGSYGSTLESVKKEMSMIEDSFGKMVKGKTAIVKKAKK
jgi:hypothetical protein